jgi:hypothetical protein
MPTVSRLEPFTGALGSAEHVAWIERGRALQRAYHASQRARKRKIGTPWPYRVRVDLRPHPGLIDDDVPEG